MTRIVAGSLGGRPIAVPPGRDVRPTSERVREALFSALQARVGLAGRRVLDLYAGSGAVGLEAASRGAAEVVLVESNPRAARTAKSNIAALGLDRVCHLVPVRAEIYLSAAPPPAPFDIVFADPPYATPDREVARVLAALTRPGWLAAGAVLVLERSTRSAAPTYPAGLVGTGERRYGETLLWFAQPVVASPRGQLAEQSNLAATAPDRKDRRR